MYGCSVRYFLRLDYVYLNSPVQRVRGLFDSVGACQRVIRRYSGSDYMLLAVRIERCV